MDNKTIAWVSFVAVLALVISPFALAFAVVVFAVILLARYFRDVRRENLSGKYTIPLVITGMPNDIVAEVTYKGLIHMWDTDFIGIKGSKVDIFDELTPDQKNEIFRQENAYFNSLRS